MRTIHLPALAFNKRELESLQELRVPHKKESPAGCPEDATLQLGHLEDLHRPS